MERWQNEKALAGAELESAALVTRSSVGAIEMDLRYAVGFVVQKVSVVWQKVSRPLYT